MKLKDLKEQIDELIAGHGTEALELDVGLTEDHEYWGEVIRIASSIGIMNESIDGPKKPARKCLVIS